MRLRLARGRGETGRQGGGHGGVPRCAHSSRAQPTHLEGGVQDLRGRHSHPQGSDVPDQKHRREGGQRGRRGGTARGRRDRG